MRAEASKGIVIHPKVLAVGGTLALAGLAIAAAFLWMVPNAAAREEKAACRGMRGDLPLQKAICNGRPCSLPAPAPDFTALDHEGKPVRLSDFRGKVVLLNFWASWCGVCKTEKPALAKMAAGIDRDDFVVLALASDRDWSDVLLSLVDSLASRPKANHEIKLPEALSIYKDKLPNGVPFKVFLDPPNDDGNIGAIAKSWGIKAVPETALIDRDGNIRAYFVNKRDWSSGVAQTCLRSVLAGD
jgi:thiol-disulfide isomerase/thioredoxin